MKTIWYVKTRFFDNGEVNKTLHELKCDKKPQDSFTEKELYDEYKNYFDKYNEAEQELKREEYI